MAMDKQKFYARVNRYKKKAMKRILFEVKKDYFAAIMEPAIKESGESTNGFIKKAIADRIGLSEEEVEARIQAYNETHQDDPETDEET